MISNIDVKTGKTEINWDQVFKAPGENHMICYWNTRSYWPTAYSPVTNSLYTSYIDNCRDLTIAGPAGRGELARGAASRRRPQGSHRPRENQPVDRRDSALRRRPRAGQRSDARHGGRPGVSR